MSDSRYSDQNWNQGTCQKGQILLTFWVKHFVFNKAENFMILT